MKSGQVSAKDQGSEYCLEGKALKEPECQRNIWPAHWVEAGSAAGAGGRHQTGSCLSLHFQTRASWRELLQKKPVMQFRVFQKESEARESESAPREAV